MKWFNIVNVENFNDQFSILAFSSLSILGSILAQHYKNTTTHPWYLSRSRLKSNMTGFRDISSLSKARL